MKLKVDEKLLKANNLRSVRKLNYFKIKLKSLNGVRKESRTSLLENIVNNSEIHDNGVLANSFPKNLESSFKSSLSVNITSMDIERANKSDTELLKKNKNNKNNKVVQNGNVSADSLILSTDKGKSRQKNKSKSPVSNSSSPQIKSNGISSKKMCNGVVNCSNLSLSNSNNKSNSKSIINKSESSKSKSSKSRSRLKSKSVVEIDLANDSECTLPNIDIKEEIVDTSYENNSLSFVKSNIDQVLHSTPIKSEVQEEVPEQIDEKSSILSPRNNSSFSRRRRFSDGKNEMEDVIVETILKTQGKRRPKNLLKLISEKNSFIKNNVAKPQKDTASFLTSQIKIKEEPTETTTEGVEAEIKERYAKLCKFKIGDLVWAQIGKFPHWPAIIFSDHEQGIYQRFHKKRHTLFIHLRFFGDKGRSSWIYLKNILPFKSRQDMNIEIKSVVTKMHYNQALDEIESLVHLDNDQRIEAFLDMNPWLRKSLKKLENNINDYGKRKRDSEMVAVVESGKKMKLMEINLDDEESQVKTEPVDVENQLNTFVIESKQRQSITKQNKNNKSKGKSKTNSKTTDSVPVEVKIDNEVVEIKVEPDVSNKENFGGTTKTKKQSKKPNQSKLIDDLDDNSFKRVLRDRSPKKEKKDESIVVLPTPISEDIDDNEEKSTNLPELKKKRQNSDAESKDSEETVESLESQTELFKKYKPLRNIPRGKVCEICLKPEDVLQCVGKCKLYFHRNCATQQAIESKITVLQASKERKPKKKRKRKTKNDSEDKSKKEMEGDVSYDNLSLQEKIDFKMKEVMADAIGASESYPEIIEIVDSEGEDSTLNESGIKNNNTLGSPNKNVSQLTEPDVIEVDFQCENCLKNQEPECYVCQSNKNKYGHLERKKCAYSACSKYFHVGCLKMWPQTQWLKNDQFHCPVHVCHTCVSDNPRVSMPRLRGEIVRCIRCPATYHSTYFCLPAGAELLSTKQIICPRHAPINGALSTINTNWCFVCSVGGNLICCETCPTSVHADCFPIDYTDDGKYFCEECESGRFHLYDEVVWVKIGSFKWWPARIVFPFEVPPNVAKIAHSIGQFVVKFYGTHDYYWVNRGRTFLFQEGDSGDSGKNLAKQFIKAVEEATAAHLLRVEFKSNNDAKKKMSILPAPYVKINKNRPYGNLKINDFDLSNITPCDCDPDDENPCGPDSNCLNRLLWTECHPEVCPAGKKCNNQRFQKREYPPLEHYKTEGKGWGLRSSVEIDKGQFIIEYVGELIDVDEYKRRLKVLEKRNEEHFYFLTLNANIIIDAGPKGNLARFMNHSCSPNCETQKWTVNGETRVGLFATEVIPPNTELTFNYNLECYDKKLKECFCKTPNCSGFIGLKSKPVIEKTKKADKPTNNKSKKKKKKKSKTKNASAKS